MSFKDVLRALKVLLTSVTVLAAFGYINVSAEAAALFPLSAPVAAATVVANLSSVLYIFTILATTAEPPIALSTLGTATSDIRSVSIGALDSIPKYNSIAAFKPCTSTLAADLNTLVQLMPARKSPIF